MKSPSKIAVRFAIALGALSSLLTGAWMIARPRDPVMVLDAALPQQGDLYSAVTATGSLQAPHSVDVKYDGQEFVDRLFVKEGEHVRRGQVLARMNAQVLEHTREQNQQLMEKDDAALVQASAYYKRELALAQDQLIAPAELEVARANYESLTHQREADSQAASGVETQIERATLRAPMDGVVTQLYVHQGEMLGSAAAVAALGSASAVSKPTNILMTIAQDGLLETWADVNAADLGSLLPRQLAEISIDAFQPTVFHGSVESIALQPVVNNGVTTYEVKIRIRRPDPRFRIGMPANVMFLSKLAGDRILVPKNAVHVTANEASVLVFRPSLASAGDSQPGSVNEVPVRIVAENEKACAVEGAIREGDSVITSPGWRSGPQHFRLRVHDFSPNPGFGDFQFNGTRPGNVNTGVVPGPEQRSFLQRILGL